MNKFTFLLVLICFSCSEIEEDKYPEMPLFGDVIDCEFDANPIDFQYSAYDCHKEFYFVNSYKNDDVIIYKKQDEEFVMVHTLENAKYNSIDKNGTFFYAYEDESGVTSFEIRYPYNTFLEIQHLDFRQYFNESEIYDRHKEEFDARNIEKYSIEYDAFINQKRKEYVDNTFTDKLMCIRKVSSYGSFYFLDYKDGTRQVIKDLQYVVTNDGIFRAATQISFQGSEEVFPYCDDMHKNFRSVDTDEEKQSCDLYDNDNTYSLELIDHIKTDRYWQGSNHIAIGVGYSNLYYYNFKIGEKTVQFKSTIPISLGESVHYKNILITDNQMYALE